MEEEKQKVYAKKNSPTRKKFLPKGKYLTLEKLAFAR